MTKKEPASSLYEQIKHHILSGIDNRRWQPGDLLPSENELTREFGVSRITVKKAMAELVRERAVYRIQGKGTYVAPEDAALPAANSDIYPENPPVALLLPFINNQFTALILSGVESVLADAGYPSLVCNTGNSQETEELVIRRLKDYRLAGLIVYPVEGEAYNREILQLTLDGFPLVVLDRYLRGIDTNFVGSDNAAGAREAVDYLIALGHRNIGFVSTTVLGTSSIEDRLSGYEKALAEHRIPIDHRYRLTHLDIETPKRDDIRAFLSQNPDMTAVFAINPGLGLELLAVAGEMGIRVPEQLSLVCFDDFELSEFHPHSPTCVRQDERGLGREAAELLVSIVEQPPRENRKAFLPPRPVIRKTTAPPLR